MKLRIFSENKANKEIVFEVLGNGNVTKHSRELIVVNCNVEDPTLAYKKNLIADTLYMFAKSETETSWCELKYTISQIMNTKIHMI
jgi:hypothetical protein